MNTTTTTHTTYARLGEDDDIHGAPLPAVQLAATDTAATGGAAAATGGASATSDSADPCVINPEAVSGNSFTHTFNKIFTQATGSSPCGSAEKNAMRIIGAIIVLFIAMLIWCCCHVFQKDGGWKDGGWKDKLKPGCN